MDTVREYEPGPAMQSDPHARWLIAGRSMLPVGTLRRNERDLATIGRQEFGA